MTTGTVIEGSGETGLIVCTPGPGMLKSIVSAPEVGLAVALASMIAWRSEPGPLSALLVTVNVASSTRSSTSSKERLTGRFRSRLRIRRLTRLTSFMAFPSERRREAGPQLRPTGQRPTTSRPDLPLRTYRCQLMPASPKLNAATATATNDDVSQVLYLNSSLSKQVSLRVNMRNIGRVPLELEGREPEPLREGPDMIGQTCRHRRSAFLPGLVGGP